MLEELRNKNVKMLVSSNSGVAAYAIAGAVSSVVSINGTTLSYICQKAHIDKKAKPTRKVLL